MVKNHHDLITANKNQSLIQQLDAELAEWMTVIADQPEMPEAYTALAANLEVKANILSLEEHNTHGAFCAEQISSLRVQASACLAEARRLDFQIVARHGQAARTLFSQRRFEESYNEWIEVIRLRPGEFDMLSRIQDPFFQEGQLDLAQKLLQHIIDSNITIAREHKLDALGLRFLRIYSNQIGHLGHLDWYVKMSLLGLRDSSRPVILADMTPNPCYLNYWRQHIPDIMVDDFAAECMAPYARYLEDGLVAVLDANGVQKADYYYATQVAIQKQWEEESRPPLLTLSESDSERGWNCLANNFGVPNDAWFVSLHVRHDTVCYSSEGTRDAVVETYIPTIQSIVERGGWVIRMGDSTMPPLPTMKNVIDYPHTTYKCDWMDVFLWAKCRFFLGTNSGPAFIPPTFGVPVVVTNWSPLGIPDLFIDGLCIFKNYWSIHEQRYLSYPEVLNSSIGFTNAPGHIEANGIRLIENTPDEILDVVNEMLDRVSGILSYSDDDNRLQKRFDQLQHKAPGVGRIGKSFLRNHSHLLG